MRAMKWLLVPVILVALGVLYFFGVMHWSYQTGERAGWVQQLSRKGWICKTWEGELALVSLPGSTPEKFHFTIWDEDTANKVNLVMGKRVALHYEQKVGLPSSCFGETRFYVDGVRVQDEISLAPGVVVPVPSAPASGVVLPTTPASAP